MFSSIGYYFLFSSIVLVHGICLDWVIFKSENVAELPLFLVKNTVCVCGASILTALLVQGVFAPAGLAALMPLAALLVFATIAVFGESLIRITAKRSVAEFTVPFLCVLFSLYETSSPAGAVLWSLCAILTYYLLIAILSVVRKRLEASNPPVFFANGSLLLLSVAAIMLITLSLAGSWLFSEVAG
jgi:Na+-translocating ferredoxin:NAD+ oxidoreductase RnfA subunit